MATIEVHLTDQGYLHLPADLARRFFPQDLMVVLPRRREVWLMPVRGAGSGGLILKQRNPQGDRSVLVGHLLPADTAPGVHPGFWDAAQGALRIAL